MVVAMDDELLDDGTDDEPIEEEDEAPLEEDEGSAWTLMPTINSSIAAKMADIMVRRDDWCGWR